MRYFLRAITLAGLCLMTTSMALAADKYLLLNYVADPTHPERSAEIMGYVHEKFGAASEASALKVGVAVIYTPGDEVQRYLAAMKSDLELAERLGVPLLIQLDTENWLPESLLNWYDPTKPGYDPAKKADVEWYGWWPSRAVKLCWRNWGTMVRVGPQPNLLSPRFQEWEKGIYEAFAPAVTQWYKGLPDRSKWLFVGWKCGWESTLNSQYVYFADGNSYYGKAEEPAWDLSKMAILGYNAAQTAGLKTSGVLDYKTGYDVFMKILGKHLTYLASLAVANGLPKEKVFLHSIAQGVDEYNIDLLVNPYANPGVSFYGAPGAPLKTNASFMRAVRAAQSTYGATGYGYGEFNLNTTDYATWHEWYKDALYGDPDCVFQALYNYDSMMGKPTVEQAILDAMALYPATQEFAYPYAPYKEGLMDPQLEGWPLTEAELAYILRPEYERRPGPEKTQYLPAMWPVTPAAGYWGGTSWLDMHTDLVKDTQARRGPIDLLLVGDSITQQWGGQKGAQFNAAWQTAFGQYKTVNLGIGGDKTQNVLWRLDHGGVEGLDPRLVILMIGNNNMFFTPETGIEAAAQGVKVCADNLRARFPKAQLVVVKILPAHAPGVPFYEDIKKTNSALDKLGLEADPKVHVLDLWHKVVNPDGTLKQGLFCPDNIHLTQDVGYSLYASKLKPLVDQLLAGWGG